MIQERRQTHFWASVILACLLPLGFLASLLWRPTYGPSEATAGSLFEQSGFSSVDSDADATVVESLEWSDAVVPTTGETFLGSGGDSRLRLALQPSVPIRQPDVLVYWISRDAATPDALPDDALLLGSLSGSARRAFLVPQAMQGQAGQLLIYSQAQDAVLSALPLAATATTLK